MKVNITLTKENLNEMLINLIDRHGYDSKEAKYFSKRIDGYPCNAYTSEEILNCYFLMYNFDFDTWYHC